MDRGRRLWSHITQPYHSCKASLGCVQSPASDRFRGWRRNQTQTLTSFATWRKHPQGNLSSVRPLPGPCVVLACQLTEKPLEADAVSCPGKAPLSRVQLDSSPAAHVSSTKHSLPTVAAEGPLCCTPSPPHQGLPEVPLRRLLLPTTCAAS